MTPPTDREGELERKARDAMRDLVDGVRRDKSVVSYHVLDALDQMGTSLRSLRVEVAELRRRDPERLCGMCGHQWQHHEWHKALGCLASASDSYCDCLGFTDPADLEARLAPITALSDLELLRAKARCWDARGVCRAQVHEPATVEQITAQWKAFDAAQERVRALEQKAGKS